MYLKSIEVQGFKSFANKTKFEFQQGITGIVGPNGSGKSNVADAVRWVLGEQSAKQLRSGNMQDVIFAGTETRKPQSFASVAITFDNSDHRLDVDYEEVTVARRLYRSGESEYLLNQVPVRLRDINEIFYDTGIGQEGYSIIGQGQIDRILSGKPEERRELFDEAAGIVKFKKRKKEALRKLDSEHQDLLRVSDVLNELTSQLGPLKKQSETARLYLSKKQELRDLDINRFLIDEERTEGELGSLQAKLDTAGSDMAETQDAFSRTRNEYERVENRIGALDAEIAAVTEENAGNALKAQQLKGRAELLQEQIRTIDSTRGQYAERMTNLAEEIRGKEASLSETRGEEKKEAEAIRLVKASEKEEAERLSGLDLEISRTTRAIEQSKNEVIGMLNSRGLVRSKIQRYDTMLEQMAIRRSEISGRLIRLKDGEKEAEKEKAAHTASVQEITETIRRIRETSASDSQKISGLQALLSDRNQRLEETMASYHRDSSRLDSLRSMAEHYDGYGNGIRRIMELKKRNPGIRGVVADLIDVPEKYETAVETALGGSIRNIVTDNEETAKHLIEFLKAGRYGRATFLPLTSIRGRSPVNRDVLAEKGVIDTADHLVRCGVEYRDLCSYLLGRAIVVDEIDHAIAIGRKYRHSVYMVTLAGELFTPGGSITGGSFRNQDNLLGRRREIEELTARTGQLKKDAESLRQELAAGKEERNRLREKVETENAEAQKHLIRLNTEKIALRQAEESVRSASESRNALEKENAEIGRQMEEIRQKNSGIKEELRTSESAESEANEKASDLRGRENELREARENQAAKLEQVRVRLAAATEKITFRRETEKRLLEELASLKKESEDLESRITGSHDEISTKETEIGNIRKAVRDTEEACQAGSGRLGELNREKEELSQGHREFFEKREELSGRISDLDREIFRLNAQKEKLESDREKLSSYMFEEYNMTPSEIRAAVLPGRRTDRREVLKEIAAAKETIRGLGNVNVDAIEEYKNVSGRYEFLNAQHEDLVKSEEALTGIISELDSGMRKQFSEKFSEIRMEFDKAFQELFGGGHGTIDIDPDADILDAGITISAHPPGKKLQNMMQLSGGEKALTAIALLFAIQNLKPSPFCLLDEIEAALDESNVLRYAQYLHKLTKNTQFIIITHRRGTMTAADRLYGITMQEKGVSALVSVNLIEDKLSN